MRAHAAVDHESAEKAAAARYRAAPSSSSPLPPSALHYKSESSLAMARWLCEARLRDVVPTVALFDRLVDVVAHASILGAHARGWFRESDASRITKQMPMPPTKVQLIENRHSCLPRPSRKETFWHREYQRYLSFTVFSRPDKMFHLGFSITFSDRLLFFFYFFALFASGGALPRADQHLTVRNSDGVLREPARLPLPEPPALALHCPARIWQRLSPHLRLVVKISR
jgi:hypothetical protein